MQNVELLIIESRKQTENREQSAELQNIQIAEMKKNEESRNQNAERTYSLYQVLISSSS